MSRAGRKASGQLGLSLSRLGTRRSGALTECAEGGGTISEPVGGSELKYDFLADGVAAGHLYAHRADYGW